ncbi:oxidoreductase NAD-binding domain-containing protein [Pseudovirgaria hyperparasitica]|uniref:NADH-cytochrome b5 reductase n=1 Tax=Pseudovirgaria hyperparasitica TaxID=470096 RepID=A0A6A6W7G7_9PEZI|nr:oxidoreductase NAD-binding domain-containing protein [Pseudovirgaria hyperparasitica]KAF2758573.1 oxidoreductase NAD-binding domain-containing protein [Pseudovirgaria hyperparasitica]
MLARQMFRPIRTLQSHVRRYATEPPARGGPSPLMYAGIAAVGGAGAWYYLTGNAKEQVASKVDAAKSLAGAESKKTFTGGDQGFISLKLESVENVNHNTKKFRFHLPEDDAVSGLHVASALLTKYKGPDMEKPVLRPYTPVSDEDQKGYLDLLVKKYPNGPMSEHMHDMEPGQRLDFKGPLPKYPWSVNKHEHIVLIAGGTGITPMYQLVRAIFNNPEDKTRVSLIFGNISEEDILLKKEFEQLENQYPRRFRGFYVLDKPSENWQGGKGFITKELVKTVAPEPKEGDKVKVFVCGPPGLYKALSGTKKSPSDQGELDGVLKELGYSKDQVYKF